MVKVDPRAFALKAWGLNAIPWPCMKTALCLMVMFG